MSTWESELPPVLIEATAALSELLTSGNGVRPTVVGKEHTVCLTGVLGWILPAVINF